MLKCPSCGRQTISFIKALFFAQKCTECFKCSKLVLPFKYNILIQITVVIILWGVYVSTGGTFYSIIASIGISLMVMMILLKRHMKLEIKN